MEIYRIYTDKLGETHFAVVNKELKDAGEIGMLSDIESAAGIIFRETAGDYDYRWHNTPCRQYVIILSGEVDFTVSDGECRRFGAGDVVLLEDVDGKGHCSQAVDCKKRKSIFVTLGE